MKVFRSDPAARARQTSCAASSAATARSTASRRTRTVETFAAVRLHIDSWRWDGVPFFIRAGKCLPVTATEVLVDAQAAAARGAVARATANYVRFRLSPDVAIALGARVKQPGDADGRRADRARVSSHQPDGDEMDAYERLLGDAMDGDATLFAREDARRGGVGDRRADPRRRRRRSTSTSPAPGGRPRPTRSTADVGGWHTPRGDRPRRPASRR